jgi:integrase
MLVQPQQAYYNFVNSINSDVTRKNYEYCMSKFLKYFNLDLDSLLKLPQLELSNLIIKYLVSQRISSQYKTVIMAAIKHACEMNDIVLNWKKIKKFVRSQKTGNEISGKDRGYTHQEIQRILGFSDQRLRTAFLILASTGIRIGSLQTIRIGDLERINDLYKITIYRGDREQYICFCSPECAKGIDAYLDFRQRRGEKITEESYLLVRKFSLKTKGKGKPFKGRALWAILEDCISNCGLREIDHVNPFKRKQIPIFHGLRKFATKQLVDSKVNPEIREILLGHKIGLAGVYYRPTEQEMLNEYLKAVPLLTISDEERLKFKLEERIQIEKTQYESLQQQFNKFKEEVLKGKMKKTF